jgi:hypothetical protein
MRLFPPVLVLLPLLAAAALCQPPAPDIVGSVEDRPPQLVTVTALKVQAPSEDLQRQKFKIDVNYHPGSKAGALFCRHPTEDALETTVRQPIEAGEADDKVVWSFDFWLRIPGSYTVVCGVEGLTAVVEESITVDVLGASEATATEEWPQSFLATATAITYDYNLATAAQTGSSTRELAAELVIDRDGSAVLTMTPPGAQDSARFEGRADLAAGTATFKDYLVDGLHYKVTGLVHYSQGKMTGELTIIYDDPSGFLTLNGEPAISVRLGP